MKNWIRCVGDCLFYSLVVMILAVVSCIIGLFLIIAIIKVIEWTFNHMTWLVWVPCLWVVACVVVGTSEWWRRYH